MNTYRPDHNGECEHCDEPLDAHVCPTWNIEIRIAELQRLGREVGDRLADEAGAFHALLTASKAALNDRMFKERPEIATLLKDAIDKAEGVTR